MATLSLASKLNSSTFSNFYFLHEDAARDGFTNLSSYADSFITNPNFQFSTDFKINGGGGNDIIYTSAGNDIVYGGSGSDIISTGNDNDQLFGGSGNDKLFAGAGNDKLDGGSGNDVLDGGSGNDQLFGGTGNDSLNGSYGHDFIDGQSGNDILTGGQGYDDFVVRLNNGVDTITDFTRGQDQLFLDYSMVTQFGQLSGTTGWDIEAHLVNTRSDIGISTGGGLNTNGPELIYDQTLQTLYYDADGMEGAGAAVELAHLPGVTHLTVSDFTYDLAV